MSSRDDSHQPNGHLGRDPLVPDVPETGSQDPAAYGCDDYDEVPVSPRSFGWHYNVFGGLLPYEYVNGDRMQWFLDAAEFIDSLPETRLSFHTGALCDHIGIEPQRVLPMDAFKTFLLIHGAPEIEKGGRHTDFLNPSYIHDPPQYVSDPVERILWLHRYGSVGVHPIKALVPLFGVGGYESVWMFAKRYGIDWPALRQHGRITLARTWYLIRAWTDYSYTDIAHAFGVETALPRRWVSRHVRNADHDGKLGGFDPVPPDPSGIKRFRTTPSPHHD